MSLHYFRNKSFVLDIRVVVVTSSIKYADQENTSESKWSCHRRGKSLVDVS